MKYYLLQEGVEEGILERTSNTLVDIDHDLILDEKGNIHVVCSFNPLQPYTHYKCEHMRKENISIELPEYIKIEQ